jgi:predicted DNA-binding transcriptional regulator YafY
MDRLERVYRLHRHLSRGRPVPARRLQEELEVSRATLMRDIQYMRDFLQAPVLYRREPSVGYLYDAEAGSFELPGFWLSEVELWGLLAASDILEDLQQGILATGLEPIRRRLHDLLARHGGDPSQVAGRVALQPLGARAGDPGLFRRVAEGVMKRRRLRIDYHARYNDRIASGREVDPLRLLFHRDNWYLLAWCRRSRGFRVFACDRIRAVEVLRARARSVTAAEIDEMLARGFGIFPATGPGAREQTALLRFTSERARWVRDESWHARQAGAALPDGGWELRIPYTEPTELILEILRHGAEVEVVAPAAVRQAVARELRRAADRYGS